MTLKNIRKARGLSVKKLSSLLGITCSAIYQYENNWRTPSIETMQKLADALDVDLITIVNCFAVTEKDKSEE